MLAEIVLDKSYLDGAQAVSVAYLCEHYKVLVSDELFFELITTSEESQKRCFEKLPNHPNPVTLIPNVGSLLRFELMQRRPCSPLSEHRLSDDYVFNRKLREGNYVFEGDVLETLNEWRAQVESDTRDFVTRCLVVHHFFPKLNGIEWKDFPKAIADARRKISSEHNFVRQIYALFLKDDAPSDALDPGVLDPRWAWFRWVQCQILAALRVFGRYQGQFPANPGARFWRNAEHSMLDIYYVILGSLVGSIASFDGEVREDFLMVCPDGVLWSPGAVQGLGS